MPYHPPFTITPLLIDLISQISEELGRWAAVESAISPLLRRENRIRSIQASLAIENKIEFIHPFSDGNGRSGRLWQTVVLAKWKPQLASLPVETVVHDRQSAYYKALAASDQQADVAPFAEFILQALLDAMISQPLTDQVSVQVSDQVNRLILEIKSGEAKSAAKLMLLLKLRHLPTFRRNYLKPALEAGLLTMTQPDSPNSPTQRYQLTENGRKTQI